MAEIEQLLSIGAGEGLDSGDIFGFPPYVLGYLPQVNPLLDAFGLLSKGYRVDARIENISYPRYPDIKFFGMAYGALGTVQAAHLAVAFMEHVEVHN